MKKIENKENIIAGDTVEYKCVGGLIHVKVLKIKSDGKLILDTRKEHIILNSKKNDKETVNLIKNVCVLPHRVKKVRSQ